MGGSLTKSPLERRNTVLRRSQRKSIHSTKGKVGDILKDIKKFKGVDEDSNYNGLKARLEALQRDLDIKKKELQPQVRNVHNEAQKKIEECYEFLSTKLQENKTKAERYAETVRSVKSEDDGNDDDIIVEEVEDDDKAAEERNLEQSTDKRRTVELKVVQIQASVEPSPKDKRASVVKMGIPVMPGSIMEALHRKSQESHLKHQLQEEKVVEIRKKIEGLEVEISQFVGRRQGKHYNNLHQQLEGYVKKLQEIHTNDEDIKEQVKLCNNYIASCLSFLNERAVNVKEDSDDDEVFINNNTLPAYDSPTNDVKDSLERQSVTNGNMSPRPMKTTYI